MLTEDLKYLIDESLKITKPCNIEEVMVRISNHERLMMHIYELIDENREIAIEAICYIFNNYKFEDIEDGIISGPFEYLVENSHDEVGEIFISKCTNVELMKELFPEKFYQSI